MMIATLFSVVFGLILSVSVTTLFVLDSRVSNPPKFASSVQARVQDPTSAITHFQSFLKIPTVAAPGHPRNVPDPQAFHDAQAFLKTTYSQLLEAPGMTLETVAEYSMLLEWKGSDPDLDPIMLYAHYDVVPAVDGESEWTFPPFSAQLHDGYVWARGAIDMKPSLIAMLEALSQLARQGFRPARTIFVGLGHDEEVGGAEGAANIAATLEARGVRLGLLWDEGTPIVADGLPVIAPYPIALIATAEKGGASFRVNVSTPGGHSAMPPIDGVHSGRILGDFLRSVDNNQPPAKMQPPVSDMLQAAAPLAPPFLKGLLFHCTVWPISDVLGFIWSRVGRETNAQVRTTFVPTHVSMGVANNVVPATASLRLDVRTVQGDDEPAVLLRHVQRMAEGALRDHAGTLIIERDELTPVLSSKVSEPSGMWWDKLKQAIQESASKEVIPGLKKLGHLPVLPTMLTGGTDSKHLGRLADSVFRFTPLVLNRSAGDLKRIHGIDERLPTQVFLGAIRVYLRGIEVMAGEGQ